MLTVRVAERFLLRLRNTRYAHVQRVAPDFQKRYGLGDLVARHSGELDWLPNIA
jgi:ATP-binding cassette, subfamily B, bacterial